MRVSRPTGRVTAAPTTTLLVAVVAAVLATVLAACTEQADAPEPPPAPPEEAAATQVPLGIAVAVILPPATDVDPGVLEAVQADVARLGSSIGPEIRDVRTFTPDEPAFVGDLATMLADRGTDLVCLVSQRSWHGILELAELHPSVHFCATGVSSDATRPEHVDLLEVRAAELGHVVGVAAREAAGSTGIVGLVLGGDDIPTATFRSGLLAGLEGAEVVEADIESSVTDAVDEVLEDGATVVVVDGAAGATEALAHAAEHAVVLGPGAVLPASGDNAVLSWRVRWDIVLRHSVIRLLGQGDAGPTSYGLAEDVFPVLHGPAATAVVSRAVEAAIDDVTEGRRDPLEPAPDAPQRPAPDADDAEVDNGEVDHAPDAAGTDGG